MQLDVLLGCVGFGLQCVVGTVVVENQVYRPFVVGKHLSESSHKSLEVMGLGGSFHDEQRFRHLHADSTEHCHTLATDFVEQHLDRAALHSPCLPVSHPQVEAGFVEVDKVQIRLRNHLGQLDGEQSDSLETVLIHRLHILVAGDAKPDPVLAVEAIESLLSHSDAELNFQLVNPLV